MQAHGAVCSGRFSGSVSTAASTGACSRRDVSMQARRGTTQVREVPVVDKLEWEQPLSIVLYPDPRLRAVNAKIGVFDDSVKQLAQQMLEIMYQDDGVGLAAPQVGVNVRMMVFNETGERGNPAETVLINPEIVEMSKATEVDIEGCLSFPSPRADIKHIEADVERASKIMVRYQDLQGQQQEMVLSSFVARVFQHEYDHLQGVLYHDRMKPSELERIRPELVKLEETFMAANPGVKVQRVAAPKAKGFGGARR